MTKSQETKTNQNHKDNSNPAQHKSETPAQDQNIADVLKNIANIDTQKQEVESSENNNEHQEASEANDITKLQQEKEELQERLLRVNAESENMRRRFEKQNQETREYAISNFAKELISVMDNLYRALEFTNVTESEDPNFKNIHQGVEMTITELNNVLEKHGIVRIMPQSGDIFDYNIHQAVSQVCCDEYKSGMIVSVMQAGYKIKDRLLRPAMVTVAKS